MLDLIVQLRDTHETLIEQRKLPVIASRAFDEVIMLIGKGEVTINPITEKTIVSDATDEKSVHGAGRVVRFGNEKTFPISAFISAFKKGLGLTVGP